MTKTFTAPFAQNPRTATAVTTAACTAINTDDPQGTQLLMTADADDGSILTRLTAMPRATGTACSLLLFISSDLGVTKRLIDSELMKAPAVSATAAIDETVFGNYSESRPLRLGPGDRLYVGNQVAVASGVVFKAEWTDF